jgi:hypothetical protein
MFDSSIVTQLALLPDTLLPPRKNEKQRTFDTFWQQPAQLPPFVAHCPTACRYLDLFGPLPWLNFPERNLQRNWGQTTLPFHALVLAQLIQLEEALPSAEKLHRFLTEHPSLIWLLGFPLYPAPQTPLGFNPRRSLPTPRHFTRLLRQMPNAALQALLTASVQLILRELQQRELGCPTCVSLDTKHILAWVKENNPKAYVTERYAKANQPKGDPDCRLGCKRKHNLQAKSATPTRNPVAAQTVAVGEYYWVMARASS